MRRRSVVDLEAELEDVGTAYAAPVGMHQVGHHAHVRLQVPVHAQRVVGEDAAADLAVVQIEVGDARGQLPGAPAAGLPVE